MKLLSSITSFHRIPGSQGIIDAAKHLYEWLKRSGIDPEIRFYRVDGETTYLTIDSSVPWDVYDGEVRITSPREELLHRFIDSPTVVMTYSPPGEVEAEVIHIKRGFREEFEKTSVKDKIVLSPEPYFSYRYASIYGAAGFMYYNPSTQIDDGVPYASVRLSKSETEIHRIPAVSVSKRSAKKIIDLLEKGERVKALIRVKTVFKQSAEIPVVSASVGDGDKEIWLTAHLCHPSPGANDNASGVAALAEGLRIYKQLIDKGLIESPGKKIRAVWTAEYLGYSAYIQDLGVEELRKRVLFNINLDMVGGDTLETGSILTLHRTPLPNFSILNLVVEEALENSLRGLRRSVPSISSLVHSVEPYGAGSDHDIFNSFSIPSIMIITWPDRYYHTDLDKPENINPTTLRLVSSIAYSSAHYISRISEEKDPRLIDFIDSYVEKVHREYITRRFFDKGYEEAEIIRCAQPRYLARVYRELRELLRDSNYAGIIEAREEAFTKKSVCEKDLGHYLDKLGLDRYRDLLNKKIEIKYTGVLLLRNIYKRLDPERTEDLRKKLENTRNIGEALNYLSLMNQRTLHEYLLLLSIEYELDRNAMDALITIVKTASELGLLALE